MKIYDLKLNTVYKGSDNCFYKISTKDLKGEICLIMMNPNTEFQLWDYCNNDSYNYLLTLDFSEE